MGKTPIEFPVLRYVTATITGLSFGIAPDVDSAPTVWVNFERDDMLRIVTAIAENAPDVLHKALEERIIQGTASRVRDLLNQEEE